MRGKLKEIKERCDGGCNQSIPEQGRWLAQVVRGYFAYHAVPTNSAAIGAFRHHVVDLWRCSLSRRSQRGGSPGSGSSRSLMTGFLSQESFIRGPQQRLPSGTRGRSRMPELGFVRICAGGGWQQPSLPRLPAP